MYLIKMSAAPTTFSWMRGLLVVALLAAPAPVLSQTREALGTLLDTITVRPFSVNIYSYPVQ
jgi:hypothetical protein